MSKDRDADGDADRPADPHQPLTETPHITNLPRGNKRRTATSLRRRLRPQGFTSTIGQLTFTAGPKFGAATAVARSWTLPNALLLNGTTVQSGL